MFGRSSDSRITGSSSAHTEFKRTNDHVYILLNEPDPDVEIVFFHGLQMQETSDAENAYWKTWKMRKSEECWPVVLLPKLLVYSDENKKRYNVKAKVLSVSYEARADLSREGIGNGSTDEHLIAENLIRDLILHRGGVGQSKGVPVVLVGHDLGGILIKEFVMLVETRASYLGENKEKLNKFLRSLKSVFFYATPHSGSKIMGTPPAVDESEINQMIRLMEVLNKYTARINDEFSHYRHQSEDSKSRRARFTSHAVHATHETSVGNKSVLIVEEGSARADNDQFYSASADHYTVCQAEDECTTRVRILAEEIILQVQTAKIEARNKH